MANRNLNNAREVVRALTEYLADTAVVYFKTHGFHWNVEGGNFYSLHVMFEKFYKELWESMDDIAERIRALGEKSPHSYAEFLQEASISEGETAPVGHVMVNILKDDYTALAKKACEVAELSKKLGDPITENMMIEKATFLEKAVWMLRSSATD